MTSSDWGDWLPMAIDDAEPTGIALWYLGCNGFVLKTAGGTTAYVDPYLGLGDPPRTIRMIPVPFDPADVTSADAIFATHEHTDHVHGPSQAPILERTGATFYGPDASVAVATSEEDWPAHWDVEPDSIKTVTEGDSIRLGDLTVHAEHAHDPDAEHPVSYVFEYGDVTIFHGGDTKPTEEFEDIGQRYDIDVGILAFGSVGNIPDKQTREPKRTRWYNDENQIVEAASALQLDTLLPSHWDMWKGLTADPTALYHHVRSFDYPHRLKLLEIGDRFDLNE